MRGDREALGHGARHTAPGETLHGPMDYRLTFEAPIKNANSHSSEFNDIARTFKLVE
jgi:hypothetical protein